MLILCGSARQTSPGKYFYTGTVHTFHSFADLKQIQQEPEFQETRHYLPGSFIFELRGKQQRELLETPGAMAYRMSNQA